MYSNARGLVMAAPVETMTRRQSPAPRPSVTPPIKIWATVGALVLAFIVCVLFRWMTGPYFQRVPAGADDPPGWMKANLIFWQIVSPLAAAILLAVFVVRPLW